MINFQRHKDPLQKLLDHAKANIDVIDFRNPDRKVGLTKITIIMDLHIKLFILNLANSIECKHLKLKMII